MTLHSDLYTEFDRIDSNLDAQLEVQEWGRNWGMSLDRPKDVLTAIDASSDADPILYRLIELHQQQGSALAGITVMRTMGPKVATMSRRHPNRAANLITEMWIRLADYPLHSRPHHIAANIALDSLKAALAHDALSSEIPVEAPADIDAASDLWVQDSRSDHVHALLTQALTIGLITPSTHRVLTAVYEEARPGSEVAEVVGISHAAVRQRCRDGVHKIRRHVAAA